MNIILDSVEQAQIFRTRPNERGRGGFQSFMVSLQGRIRQGQLVLTQEDLEKINRYAHYDNGGYEGRLRKAFGRHLPDVFGEPPKETGDFF